MLSCTIFAESILFLKVQKPKQQCFKCNFRYHDDELNIQGCVFPNHAPICSMPVCDCNIGVRTTNIRVEERFVRMVDFADVLTM